MTPTTPLRFPRCAHLRASAEFQAVFGEGIRVSGTQFRLHVRFDAVASARLGVAVSKRVSKSAVERNRIRRQIKESFRRLRAELPVADYVMVAKPGAAQAENTVLRRDLLSLFNRVRTLKRSPPPGTMPPAIARTDCDPSSD